MDSTMYMSHGIDVIIRFHDPKRFVELDRALFSLLHQRFRQVHPIVVTQDFDQNLFEQTRTFVERHGWKELGQRMPTVVRGPNGNGRDLRSHLLNIGVDNLESRYMAILDSDDYLYGNAYEVLIGELERSGAAIAFATVLRKDVRTFEEFVYSRKRIEASFRGRGLTDLAIDNFCPIHSFVVDRAKVKSTEIRFNEQLSRLEDYEFLLRICRKFPSSFAMIGVVIGVYNWTLGGRFLDELSISQETKEWNRARRYIWNLKCQLRDKIKQEA